MTSSKKPMYTNLSSAVTILIFNTENSTGKWKNDAISSPSSVAPPSKKDKHLPSSILYPSLSCATFLQLTIPISLTSICT